MCLRCDYDYGIHVELFKPSAISRVLQVFKTITFYVYQLEWLLSTVDKVDKVVGETRFQVVCILVARSAAIIAATNASVTNANIGNL